MFDEEAPTYDDQPYPPVTLPGRDESGKVEMVAEFLYGPTGGTKQTVKLHDILDMRSAYKQAAGITARMLPQRVRVSRFTQDGSYVELKVVVGNSYYRPGDYMLQTPQQLFNRYQYCPT